MAELQTLLLAQLSLLVGLGQFLQFDFLGDWVVNDVLELCH